MAVDLTPRQPAKAYGGEGGAYYEWSPAELPMLGVASIGAAKLALAAGGMSLPSYFESAKVAYVLQVTYTTDPISSRAHASFCLLLRSDEFVRSIGAVLVLVCSGPEFWSVCGR